MKSLRNFSIRLSPSSRFAWNNYVQRPGEGIPRNVTLVPGHGIGPEITSFYPFFFENLILS